MSMSTVSRLMAVPTERVWAVLADGWLYPLWVVGATHMREVDAGWPAVGSKLHHSVGAWPAMITDTTDVVAAEPGRTLVLDAHASTFGTARVAIELAERPEGTRVTMTEYAVAGPARLVLAPVQRALLGLRNREALARLDNIATNRKE
jgi:uncharacterized protein YndB with AHSA1/START domain